MLQLLYTRISICKFCSDDEYSYTWAVYLTEASICLEYWGGHNLWRRDDRSLRDRARPKAVLGVGAGGGRPLPQRGSGGVTPGKNLNSTLLQMSFGAFAWVKKVMKRVKEALSICQFSTI